MQIDLNGSRLWFDVDGLALVPQGRQMRKRPTVVMVHGGPGVYDHSYFKPFFAPLTRWAQVVYLDLRGHGRSTWGDASAWTLEACADDLRAFCDAVGIDKPIVFGHSMGGPIVLLYGARHPGHASGLIVQSGFARWDPPRLVEGFRRVAGDKVAKLAERSYRGDEVTDEESALVFAAFGTHVPGEEREERTPKNLELNVHGMELIRQLDILDQLSRVTSPTLVSVGELDPVTPVEAAEEIVDALPDGLGRLEVIPGAGHFTWLDAPEPFGSAITGFIDGLTGGRRGGSTPSPRPSDARPSTAARVSPSPSLDRRSGRGALGAGPTGWVHRLRRGSPTGDRDPSE
jgi:pimeloyl-ACP methyl ester carboxylesterase